MDASRILRLARRRAGLTQQELALRARTPQPAISRIERGQVSPSVDTLERLLRACNHELESVPSAAGKDLDWDEIDDRLDMSPAERAHNAASAGRSMLRFLATGPAGAVNGTPFDPAVDETPFDPVAVLRTLRTRGVEFVVIGGFGAALRGSPVITGDVDICYAQHEGNRRRLANALIELEARMPGVNVLAPSVIEDALELGERCSFDTTAGTVDTIATPNATNGYPDLVVDAEWFDIDDCIVLVPSLDDLVRMRVDAEREEERLALQSLRAVRQRLTVTYR